MAYKYEYVNIVGSMSVRPAPNTNNTPIGTLPMNVHAFGNELTELPNGDKWLKIEKTETGQTLVGYVAVIHLGKPYGKLTEISNPDPTPTPQFPQSFVLTNPDGTKGEFQFVRVIE